MTDEIFWRYEFDYSPHAFEVWAHEAGRIIRVWAGCQNFRFGPERENLFLLTSPFIERISQNDSVRAGAEGPPMRQV
jgi:hypothetical protein